VFYSVNRRTTIHQVLAQSFSKDQGDLSAKANNIYELSIYMIDSSDMSSIYALAKDMAVTFPQISLLYLWFERRCEIVSFLLTIDDYTSKGYMLFSHYRRLEKASLSSPICVTHTPMSGPRHDGNADPNIG
jgi:hypothetical protein